MRDNQNNLVCFAHFVRCCTNIYGFFIFEEYSCYGEDDEDYKLLKKWTKIAGIVLAISLTLLLFVPSEETLYKMQLAKLTTVENVDKTFEYIDKAVDKILEQK